VKTVGYLFHRPEGTDGERGIYYNYLLASNGLFIEAENKLISARIPIANCEVRGLAPLEKKFILTYGSIPQRFFDLSLNMFLADTTREHYVAVVGDAGYHFYIPVQDKEGGTVIYELGDRVVLDLHSHTHMRAFFSTRANADEKGLKVYGGVGNLGGTPVVKLRLGVYGYYLPLSWRDVFDGCLVGAVENEGKEVIGEDELQSVAGESAGGLPHHRSWLWGDWWFRR